MLEKKNRKKIIKRKVATEINELGDVKTKSIKQDGVEILMHQSQSSCNIKQDSKGGVTFEVKVYSDDESDAVEKAIKQFRKLSKELV